MSIFTIIILRVLCSKKRFMKRQTERIEVLSLRVTDTHLLVRYIPFL